MGDWLCGNVSATQVRDVTPKASALARKHHEVLSDSTVVHMIEGCGAAQRMAHALFWSHLNQRLKRPAEQRQRTSNCVPKSFSTDFKTCFSWPARCNHCCCSSSQNACDNASQSCHQVQGVPHVFAVIRDQSLYAEGH